jgi:hypothetical protein
MTTTVAFSPGFNMLGDCAATRPQVSSRNRLAFIEMCIVPLGTFSLE